jgi:SAM-dependent methyltransferase
MNAESHIQSLLASNPLREAIFRAMTRTLQLPKGSRGLDAGCGIGLPSILLADAVGLTGHVTGLDISSEMLDFGRDIVREAGLSEQISFQQGDVTAIPFADETFDWVWSADCVGYGPWEPLPLLKELLRVLKPGGIMAIAAWSSEKLLPGYPRLEARLGATSAGIAPFIQGKSPGSHFVRALGWFHELGLIEPRGQVFADCAHAPMNDEVRIALADLFDMRWPNVANELSPDEFAEFQRLCTPDSPDYILNLPDYYALFTYTMFWGKKQVV